MSVTKLLPTGGRHSPRLICRKCNRGEKQAAYCGYQKKAAARVTDTASDFERCSLREGLGCYDQTHCVNNGGNLFGSGGVFQGKKKTHKKKREVKENRVGGCGCGSKTNPILED